jgi:EAL domain-containing protein (putative c-di-GMP-specific phosphodiesterase class I)
LAYLQKLPVDNVKIDRSFVVEINQKKGGRSIVSSIITLAHNLDLTVTAEGVEHDSLLKLLRYLGCDYAQGYHLGKPMAGDDVPAWLRTLYLKKTGS